MAKRKIKLHSKSFPKLVAKELKRARKTNPGGMRSHHESFSVVLEEVDEYWEQVKKKSSKRDHKNVLEELVQIAAMAQRSAEDLGYTRQA